MLDVKEISSETFPELEFLQLLNVVLITPDEAAGLAKFRCVHGSMKLDCDLATFDYDRLEPLRELQFTDRVLMIHIHLLRIASLTSSVVMVTEDDALYAKNWFVYMNMILDSIQKVK